MRSPITPLHDLDPFAYSVYDAMLGNYLDPTALSLVHSIYGTHYPLCTVDTEALDVIMRQAEAWRTITEHPAVRVAFLYPNDKTSLQTVLDLLNNA